MKHSEVITLRNKLSRVHGLKGFELKYLVRQNLEAANNELKALEPEEKKLQELVDPYNKEIKIIAEEAATINKEVKYKKDSNPFTGEREYDIPESRKAKFEKDKEALEKKHKKALDEFKKKSEAYNKFLEEKESKFKKIDIPKEVVEEYDSEITDNNLDAIYPLIVKGTKKK